MNALPEILVMTLRHPGKREKSLSPDIILARDYPGVVRLDQAGEDLALHPYYMYTSGKGKTDTKVVSSE